MFRNYPESNSYFEKIKTKGHKAAHQFILGQRPQIGPPLYIKTKGFVTILCVFGGYAS